MILCVLPIWLAYAYRLWCHIGGGASSPRLTAYKHRLLSDTLIYHQWNISLLSGCLLLPCPALHRCYAVVSLSAAIRRLSGGMLATPTASITGLKQTYYYCLRTSNPQDPSSWLHECLSAHSVYILCICRLRTANYTRKWIPGLSPQYQHNIYIYTVQQPYNNLTQTIVTGQIYIM